MKEYRIEDEYENRITEQIKRLEEQIETIKELKRKKVKLTDMEKFINEINIKTLKNLKLSIE